VSPSAPKNGRADPSALGRSSALGSELALAIELAHQAGAIQMERYEHLERVEAKGPRDVVTEVDHLCEKLVMAGVHERYPNDRFLAEEIGDVPAPGETPSGRVWVVDPLDGTVNYANGIPFFCISIALVADGHPVVGVVYDPARDETFTGSIDGPALRNGQPMRVSTKERLEDLVVTMSVGGRGTARRRRQAIRSIRANRSLGSAALTMAYVACGRFDVYAQSAGLSAWDLAAAGLMAERAGAMVTSLDGSPWFDLSRPAKRWSCLAAAPAHHAAMRELLGSAS
jgi:myo-inositol-1(or 4)-monophosphatase